VPTRKQPLATYSLWSPDLILIDMRLASGSGFDVLKALQDHSLAPGATKVVLTNYTNAEYKNLSIRLGTDRFFDKSAETAQALALIDALAAERRTSRASLQSPSAVLSIS